MSAAMCGNGSPGCRFAYPGYACYVTGTPSWPVLSNRDRPSAPNAWHLASPALRQDGRASVGAVFSRAEEAGLL